MQLDGLHHISAITADAARNVDFYTRVLGLRLVAKTVNQDDPNVYHLFYGDEEAHPGFDLTFFEYPGAAPGRPGAGMVHRIVWRVADEAALDFWAGRLTDEGVPNTRAESSLRFSDPEGLDHELTLDTSPDEPLRARHPLVPAKYAIVGFEGVRAYSARPDSSAPLLERVMGAARIGSEDRWELRSDRRGAWVAYDTPPAERGRPSAGTVHHIAWGMRMDDLDRWFDRIDSTGIPNSGKIDRTYFRSIYFREPSGVLFELATDAPGFTVDGPVETLGSRIILPPWLEPQREQIEANLTPLPDTRADWAAAQQQEEA